MADVLEIPILRAGRRYDSAERTILLHHATGRPLADMSLANPGLITRDVRRMDAGALEGLTVRELLARCRRAAELFMTAPLPLGAPEAGPQQTFDEYVACLSGTTGMPVTYCRANAQKIHRVLAEMEGVLAGLTRGLALEALDAGYAERDGRMLSFQRTARVFGGVLPSNSPGVHSLWIPAVALKTPIALKPGREEPWTPLRVIAALIAAGVPREAFGFYPCGHDGATALLQAVDRAMLFGDASTTRPWADDPRVELHGPGYSKILLGADWADNWADYVDLMVESIGSNAGRSCINASGVWTPRHGRAIAEALAQRFAGVEPLAADDPRAQVAAFANPQVAERISAMIDAGLRQGGAEDVTAALRGGPRLVRRGGAAWLLPTIIRCESPDHPLANREFLLPYAAVVECPQEQMVERMGPTLIASALTGDRAFVRRLMSAPQIDRLNIGPIPTNRISWDQPHEGNLFEHLYRQRALQIAAPADGQQAVA